MKAMLNAAQKDLRKTIKNMVKQRTTRKGSLFLHARRICEVQKPVQKVLYEKSFALYRSGARSTGKGDQALEHVAKTIRRETFWKHQRRLREVQNLDIYMFLKL